MPIKSVMPSSHLILCRPLLLLPPIPLSIRVFSNDSAVHMRWPKYWSFSFSISPSSKHPGLISFRKCKSQPQGNNISYLLGMYIIKKADNNKHSCRSGETRTFICCQWECKIMELFWKTSWQFLKKLNIELLYNLVIPLLGIYPPKLKTGIEYCT